MHFKMIAASGFLTAL